MGYFSHKNPTLEVVRKELSVPRDRQARTLRLMNRYLSGLVNEHGVLFQSDKTLTTGARTVKCELAGGVLLHRILPTLENPQSITVALPIRGTHDNRAYLAAILTSEAIASEVIERQDRTEIAHEVATMAVHGYLQGEISAAPLTNIERLEPMLQVLLRNR